MAHGFVYVLGNESMPGIYKIGFTLRHPKDRMEELSRATACPTPFELLAYIGCEDPQWTEGEIHNNLAEYRINESREFFKIDPDLIQDQLRQYGDPALDTFYDRPLDWHITEQWFINSHQWKVDYFLSQEADAYEWPRGFN